MEVQINKEIREYTEKLFFGLTIRQFVFGAGGILVALLIFLFARDYIPIDVMSWLIMPISLPMFLIGFWKYNGMNFEQFVAIIVKNKILTPRKLTFKPTCLYYETKSEREIENELSSKKGSRKTSFSFRRKGRSK